MALKDLVIPTVEVVVAGGSFAVRGLSANDIEMLLRVHGSDFKVVWDGFLNDKTDLSKLDIASIGKMLGKIAAQIPAAVADLIGLAADADDDDLAKIRKLPVGSQTSALGAILSLTLNTDGDWAKTLETVMNLIGAGNGALTGIMKVKADALP